MQLFSFHRFIFVFLLSFGTVSDHVDVACTDLIVVVTRPIQSGQLSRSRYSATCISRVENVPEKNYHAVSLCFLPPTTTTKHKHNDTIFEEKTIDLKQREVLLIRSTSFGPRIAATEPKHHSRQHEKVNDRRSAGAGRLAREDDVCTRSTYLTLIIQYSFMNTISWIL